MFVNTDAPATAIFFKTVTLIFNLDFDRWPWTYYQQKGLVTRYTHVKFEGLDSYQSIDMTNVKVFADKQTGQKLYAPASGAQKGYNTGYKSTKAKSTKAHADDNLFHKW